MFDRGRSARPGKSDLWPSALCPPFFVLIPPDLPAFILFFEPALQRLEVFGHGTRGNIFPGRFFQYFAPIFRGALLQDTI